MKGLSVLGAYFKLVLKEAVNQGGGGGVLIQEETLIHKISRMCMFCMIHCKAFIKKDMRHFIPHLFTDCPFKQKLWQ